MDRPRLDSDLQRVESLFKLTRAGVEFVRLATNSGDTTLSLEALAFARHAYQAIQRQRKKVALTPSEDAALQTGLNVLRRAIDSAA